MCAAAIGNFIDIRRGRKKNDRLTRLLTIRCVSEKSHLIDETSLNHFIFFLNVPVLSGVYIKCLKFCLCFLIKINAQYDKKEE